MNLSGTSIYLYTNLGSKDLIMASAIGVSHHAFADALDFDTQASSLLDGYAYEYDMGSEYRAGPFTLLLEPSQGFEPYRFHAMTDADYLGVEFPWLLIPCLLLLLGVWRMRQTKRRQRLDARLAEVAKVNDSHR